MKKFGALVGLVVSLMVGMVSNFVFAQVQGQGQGAANNCVPYSIPMAGVPCDRGYTGTKFPMQTKVCPSGQVTIGTTFNTENCKLVNAQPVNPNQTNCAISPQLIECTSAPTLKGCDAGWHWSLSGSAISHCVPDDPICPWGQSLVHNALGFPSCVQNTCPANQVLQADGISCACAGGLIWNGASCVAACVPSTVQETSACSLPLLGTRVRDVTTDCVGNVTRSAWDASGCAAAPPGCPLSTSIPQACPPNQTGTSYLNTTYGPAPGCLPSVSTDNSGCTPIGICPVDSSIPQACSGGKLGTAYLITRYGPAPACTAAVTIDENSCFTAPPVPTCDPGVVASWTLTIGGRQYLHCWFGTFDALKLDPNPLNPVTAVALKSGCGAVFREVTAISLATGGQNSGYSCGSSRLLINASGNSTTGIYPF